MANLTLETALSRVDIKAKLPEVIALGSFDFDLQAFFLLVE